MNNQGRDRSGDGCRDSQDVRGPCLYDWCRNAGQGSLSVPDSLRCPVYGCRVEIDEPTLKQIAATTGGQYFRATDNASLKEIYSEIDKMEKTKISVQEYSKKQEEYKNWAILLFSLLLVEILLRNTLLRNIP